LKLKGYFILWLAPSLLYMGMRKYLPYALVFLAVFTLGLGLKRVSSGAKANPASQKSSLFGSILPALATSSDQPRLEPALLKSAKGAELFNNLFPASRIEHWSEEEAVAQARERFANAYPPAGDPHHDGPREKEIVARMGILKAMGASFRGPAAQAFYREVLKSDEHLLVRRQALENLRPMMAGLPETDRGEILAGLPPRLVALAAFTEKELLEKVWRRDPSRSLSEAAEKVSLNKWENLPCPTEDRFFELAEPLGWTSPDPYVCDLSPQGKFGRALEFLATLKLPLGDHMGAISQNLANPYEYLKARSKKISFNFSLVHAVAVNAFLQKRVELGAAFFAGDPLESLSVLIHEARHSDAHEDQGHEVCLQGDLPRVSGGCDRELSYGRDAGAYSYGLFFSMALAREDFISEGDRESLESDSLLLVSRRFNRLLSEMAYFQDAIAGLDSEGKLVVLHPFVEKEMNAFGVPEEERFTSLAYSDSTGGLNLFGKTPRSWMYGFVPGDIFPGVKLSGTAELARKIRIPGDSFTYGAFLDQGEVYYLKTDPATSKRAPAPFPLDVNFAVKDFFIGDLVYSYFLTKEGELLRMRSKPREAAFTPAHQGTKFLQASSGVLRDTVFAVGQDGLLYHHEFRPYPIGINTQDDRTTYPVEIPTDSALVKAEFQSPIPAVQYEEGTSVKALLDEEGGLWVGYHGENSPSGRLRVKLKAFAIMKLTETRGFLAHPKKDAGDFRRRCGVAENAVDPWFNRGVGISKGTLYFEGDRGECLAASLPDGLQGRIANFSFEPGAFAGKYGSRTYHFAAAGLELKLNDGTTRTVLPYEGWGR
jgi:hypothetical protein